MKALLFTLAIFCVSASMSEARSYSCVFHKTCAGEVQPCEDGDFPVLLSEQNGNWTVLSRPDFEAHFTPVGNTGADMLSLVSTDIDTDAYAAALLSISPRGEALLTIHGDFFGTIDRIAMDGTCTEENG